MQPRHILALASAALGLLLAGCGGSGATYGSGTTSPPPTNTVPMASYGWIQDNVFTPRCVSCHSGPSAPEGLQLDAANAPFIVGRASAEVPALSLVAPGMPDASYLILKVEGAAGISGLRMPYGGPYLDDATIQAMRDWVTSGAPVP